MSETSQTTPSLLETIADWVFSIFGYFMITVFGICVLTLAGSPSLVTVEENRTLASAPTLPGSAGEILDLPAQITDYTADHFFSRDLFVVLNSRVHVDLLNTSPISRIIFGEDGYWFLAGGQLEDQLAGLQSACGLVTPTQAERDRLLRLAQTMEDSLPSTRIRYAIVPSKLDVHRDRLPYLQRLACARGDGNIAHVFADDLNARFGAGTVFYPSESVAGWEGPLLYARRFHWARGDSYTTQFRDGVLQNLGEPAAPQEVFASRPQTIGTDFGSQIPGIPIAYDFEQTFWTREGGETIRCRLTECRPDFAEVAGHGFGPANAVYTRNAIASSEESLLIIGDSFVSGVEDSFAANFAETLVINIKATQNADGVWDWLLSEYAPETILVLMHDGSADFMWSFLPGTQIRHPDVRTTPMPVEAELETVVRRQRGNRTPPFRIRRFVRDGGGIFEVDASGVFRFTPGEDADQRVLKGRGMDVRLNDAGQLVLFGDPVRDNPGGQTGGLAFALSAEHEARLAEQRVRVRAIVEGTADAEARIAYSTADRGHSGWQTFTLTGGQDELVFEYDVPAMDRGRGDFVGLMPPTGDELIVHGITVEILPTVEPENAD